jgi:threonine dehydratase
LLLETKDSFSGQTVAVVISGGNIDPYMFNGIIAAEE